MLTVVLVSLAFVIWLGAVLAPPLLAFWFWNTISAKYGRRVAHLLYVPCVIAVEYLLARMYYFIVFSGGSKRTQGFELVLPYLSIFGSFVLYYICAGFVAVRSRVRTLNIRFRPSGNSD